MKRILTLILAAALLLSISACTKRTQPEPEETPEITTPAPTPTPEAPVETPEPPREVLFRNAFNGEPLDEPDYTRPYAVMLNNHLNAQPQCSMENADIIFEVLAEGGITRMMAIYSDMDFEDPIGPIRSIRTYYVSIAMSFDAITVYAGWSPGARTMIRNNGIDIIDGVSDSSTAFVFYRDSSRIHKGYEHSLFAKGTSVIAGVEQKGYETEVSEEYSSGLSFADDVLIEKGEKAEAINVVFNSGKSTSFTYHEDKASYTATQYSTEYYDGNTGDAVEYENVIVFSARASVIDGEGRLDITLVGEGEGYFFHNGKVVPISWSRESENSPFLYTYEDGSEVVLGVGKTYICIIPTSSGAVTYE